ncbi:O-antigen ligase family protein [Aporhodopirellula aestuarii]|uniref:O-antigen ligase family protein n=1 Tax=Aporhodopirellula aestuarii TaxID=2950107 RepID=A0ABT0UDA8_9BACT|nr:O-antigen ligase family protein [Aporhodopirellula aestuarii]MCM2374836.1 O-antigen ligase family protein [Aporhodopirellula aestuarii]
MSTATLPASHHPNAMLSSTDDRHGWGLVLLVAVVATLFVRPADLLPALQAWPIYQFLIIGCLVVAYRAMLRQLSFKTIASQPVTACVLLLLMSVTLSHLAHGFLWAARASTYEVSKLIALFLLIVGLVNTPGRLFLFVKCLSVAITFVALLALLDRYELYSIGALESIEDRMRTVDQASVKVDRIRGTGIFNDPNDFGMILVTGLILCASSFMRPGAGIRRYVWLTPIGILMATLALTHSRGALLSLAAVVPAAVVYRLGWKYAVSSLFILPGLAMFFSARMTNVQAITDGTGQSRIQIWSDCLVLWRQYPIFGSGEGMLVEEIGVVAHNSFLHCFVELGAVGGTAFAASFMATLLGLWSLRDRFWDPESEHSAPELHRLAHLRMFLFAAVSAYAIGITTISRQFVAPTFLILGLGTTAQLVCPKSLPTLRLNNRFFVMCMMCGIGVLLICQVAVRVFNQF